MPERRSHSVILPLVLILLGVALLLEQFGWLSVSWFDLLRLWPLALVLLGLDIILSRTRLGGLISLVVVLVLVALFLLFYRPLAPVEFGQERETFAHPLQGIERARMRLEVDAGQLDVAPLQDSSNLFEAEVVHDRRRSEVRHEVDAKGGEATVRLQGKLRDAGWMRMGSRSDEAWQVRLHPAVSTELDMNTGVGRSKLNLAGLKISRLRLNTGVGDVEVLLSEQGDYSAAINGGVGKITVQVPQNTEARIRVDRGLGAIRVDQRFRREGNYYVSAGYGSARNRVDLQIEGGIGEITVR